MDRAAFAFRAATPADASVIARLHADSWRRTYRGILRDDYLDGDVDSERQQVWATRLGQTPLPDRQWIRLLESGGQLKGFICVFLDEDPEWGALVDNLHVAHDWQGQGWGRRLMAEAAQWIRTQRPDSRMHLWVFAGNRAAHFYERIGGVVTLRQVVPTPDGSEVEALRYGWADLTQW